MEQTIFSTDKGQDILNLSYKKIGGGHTQAREKNRRQQGSPVLRKTKNAHNKLLADFCELYL